MYTCIYKTLLIASVLVSEDIRHPISSRGSNTVDGAGCSTGHSSLQCEILKHVCFNWMITTHMPVF